MSGSDSRSEWGTGKSLFVLFIAMTLFYFVMALDRPYNYFCAIATLWLLLLLVATSNDRCDRFIIPIAIATLFLWIPIGTIVAFYKMPVSAPVNSSQPSVAGQSNTRNPGSDYGLYVGQNLFFSDGKLYGKIIQTESIHNFGGGALEAAVLVDFSGRADMEGSPPPPLWMPSRSAALMSHD